MSSDIQYILRNKQVRFTEKMKIVLLIFVVTIVGLNAHTVKLSDAQKEKASQHTVECVKQSGVKPEVLAEVKKGHLVDDEAMKKFTLCFFQKAGIVDSHGKLNTDVALSKLPPGIDKTDAAKVLEGCKDKKGKTVEDTAYEIFKCYQSGTKTHIMLA